MLTLQKTFDLIASHLLAQGKRALLYPDGVVPEEKLAKYHTSLTCAYRAPTGEQCAVGCLISSDYYKFEVEGQPLVHDGLQAMLRQSGVDVDNGEVFTLLRRTQSIHDYDEPENWAYELKKLALDFGLNADVVKAVQP